MSTPKKVQLAGGSTAQEDAYIGLDREVRVDTSRKELRVHDSVTPGGHRLPNISEILRLINGATYIIYSSDFNDLTSADPGDGTTVYVISSDVTGLDVNDWGGVYVFRPGAIPTNIPGLVWAAAGGGYWLNVTGMSGRGSSLITNLNNIVANGINYINGSSGTNLPVAGADYWTVFTSRASSGATARATQLAIPINNIFEPYFRTHDGGVWSSWRKFAIDGVTVDAYNSVGSYLFATNAGATTAPGSALAGSNLTPAAHDNASTGGARSGTWRAMGNGVTLKSTLWTRTA